MFSMAACRRGLHLCISSLPYGLSLLPPSLQFKFLKIWCEHVFGIKTGHHRRIRYRPTQCPFKGTAGTSTWPNSSSRRDLPDSLTLTDKTTANAGYNGEQWYRYHRETQQHGRVVGIRIRRERALPALYRREPCQL